METLFNFLAITAFGLVLRGRAVSPVEAGLTGTLDEAQVAEWPFLGRVIPRVKAFRYTKSPK